jgi:hypothetical protein
MASVDTFRKASSWKSYFPIVTFAIVSISVSPAKGDKPETLEHRNKRREENTKSEANLSYATPTKTTWRRQSLGKYMCIFRYLHNRWIKFVSTICGYDDMYVFQFRWINLEKFVFIKTELVLPFFLSKVAYINPHIQIWVFCIFSIRFCFRICMHDRLVTRFWFFFTKVEWIDLVCGWGWYWYFFVDNSSESRRKLLESMLSLTSNVVIY